MIEVFLVTFKKLVCHLTVMVLSLMVCASCYEPEEYVPPVYLEPEVSLVVDNIPWDTINDPGFTLNFQNNRFYFGVTNKNLNAGFLCSIEASDREKIQLFYNYSGGREVLPIKVTSYRTNDTIDVRMNYQLHGVGDDSDGRPDYDYWSASDAEFNVFIIEDAFIDDLEIYVSGSFSARAEPSTDKQFPRYRFIEGAFKNVRVTKTYYKSQ